MATPRLTFVHTNDQGTVTRASRAKSSWYESGVDRSEILKVLQGLATSRI